MSAVCFSRPDSAAATCVVAHVRHAKPAKARCVLFNHFPAHRLPCMCPGLRTCVCVCPMRLLACVCVPRLLIRALDDDLMCRVSFTPVRARDTVKLIEPKHSFARGFPPQKKTKSLTCFMSKLVAAVSGLLRFFLFIFFYCATERKQQQRAKIPSPPLLACQYVLYVCVLRMRERERVNSQITREALQWKLIMRL